MIINTRQKVWGGAWWHREEVWFVTEGVWCDVEFMFESLNINTKQEANLHSGPIILL